jgi:hypothetical protein
MSKETEDYSPAMQAKMNTYMFFVTDPDGKEKVIANFGPPKDAEEKPKKT